MKSRLMIALALVLVPVITGSAFAQVNREVLRVNPGLVQPQRIWVVRGEGTRAPEVVALRPDPPPPELTLQEKTALLAGLGTLNSVLGPWRVTPGEPKIPGRMWLLFADVANMATNSDPANTFGNVSSYAYLDPGHGLENVTVVFLPPSLGRYLVDCRVKKIPASVPYHVKVYPGGAEQTFGNTDHLIFVYEAASLTDAAFVISASGDGHMWGFYSCEITPLVTGSG